MHKTPKAHEVGSTAWYKAMAVKLDTVTYELRLDRMRWKHRLPLSFTYDQMKEYFKEKRDTLATTINASMLKQFPFAAADFFQSWGRGHGKVNRQVIHATEETFERYKKALEGKDVNRYIAGCDPAVSPVEVYTHKFANDGTTMHNRGYIGYGNALSYSTGSHNIAFNYPNGNISIGPESGYSKPENKPVLIDELPSSITKIKHLTEEEKVKQSLLGAKLPIMDTKTGEYISGDEMLKRFDDCIVRQNYFGKDNSVGTQSLKIQKTPTDDFFRRHGITQEDWRESNRMFKKYYEDNFDDKGKPKTFEDKVYYLKKYNSFIQVKYRAGETLILSGLCICLEDTKTTSSRQRITVNKFLDLSPIELDQTKLHMYSSFMYYKAWGVTVGGTWTVKGKHDHKSSYMEEAEMAPSVAYTTHHGLNWPMF